MKKILAMLVILCTLISLTSCELISNIFVKKVPFYINGVEIFEYNIVYDEDGLDYNKRAAEYVQGKIAECTNVTLPIVDDSTEAKAHEIVIGETSRDISKELNEATEGFEFAMLAKNGSVALEADYFVIAAAAYYFADSFVKKGEEVSIPDGVTVREPVTKEAKNLIMLIGDGMGLYQTKLFDYLNDPTDYSDGENLFYGYMFPYHGFTRTSSYSGITDSAAGGTALSTGYKTVNSHIGLDRDGNSIKSLTELAAELGKSTAVLSTDKNTGATPATFSAHAPDRDDSLVILESQVALTKSIGTIVECGFDYYTAKMMPTIEGYATNTLNTLSEDEDGFFLMYEEGHIDKKSHNNDMEYTFKALIRFNQVIARFMEYAFYNPDTFVLITADHETGGLLPTDDGKLAYNTEEHTAADVPVFAWGHGAEFFDGKTVENVEIAHYFASLMGVDDFGDQTRGWYDEIYGE